VRPHDYNVIAAMAARSLGLAGRDRSHDYIVMIAL
jgi:hypothetical protein